MKKHTPELSRGKKAILVCVGIVATVAVVIMGNKIYSHHMATNPPEMKAVSEGVTVSITRQEQNLQEEPDEPKSGFGAVLSSLDQSEKKIINEDCDYSVIVVSLESDTPPENEESPIKTMKEKVKQAAWNAGVSKVELVEEQPTQLYYQMSPKNLLGRLLRALGKTGLKAGIVPDAIAPAC